MKMKRTMKKKQKEEVMKIQSNLELTMMKILKLEGNIMMKVIITDQELN